MSVHNIQKIGSFSEIRKVIQKVLRVLKFLFLGENVILKWDVYLRVHTYCNNDFHLASSVGVNSVRDSIELFFQRKTVFSSHCWHWSKIMSIPKSRYSIPWAPYVTSLLGHILPPMWHLALSTIRLEKCRTIGYLFQKVEKSFFSTLYSSL